MDPFNIKASLKALAASKRQEPSSYQPPPQEEPRDPIQKLGGRIQKDIVKEAPPGLLERAGGTALSGLATVGNLLDVPGSMVRDVATWLPGGPKPANPLDQLVSPFTHHNRTTGRELLRGYGLAGKEDTMGNFTTGLGAEIALDPLTYLTFGAGALTRGGRAAKALNMMDDAPEIASRLLNRRVGKREARHVVTPRMLLDNPKLGVETKLKLQDRLQKMGVTEKDMDRQLGGLAKISMPFSNKPFKFGDKPFTFWGLTDEEGIIGAGKARGRGPDFLKPVQHNVPDPEDFGPSGGSALGGDGPDIPPTQGPAPDLGDMPDSPIAPTSAPEGGIDPTGFDPSSNMDELDQAIERLGRSMEDAGLNRPPEPQAPSAADNAFDPSKFDPNIDMAKLDQLMQEAKSPPSSISAVSDIQKLDENNFGVVASIPNTQTRARATLTYASEADETPMLFIDQFQKQPGSAKGTGRALINSMVEKVKDRNPMGVAGNFDTHDQLGAFASVFGKDKIRFLDRATGQPVDIPFAEVNKTPETISKYTAVHYFIEPPKAAAKVEPEIPPQIVDPAVPSKVDVVDDAEFLKQSEIPSGQAKLDLPVSFKTERGSEYRVLPDGTTQRNKAKRWEHGNDSGIKEPSAKTIYVDDDGRGLSGAGLQGINDFRVVFEPDNTVSLVTLDPDTGKWGRTPSSTKIKYYSEPAIGRHPLELWKREDLYGLEGYRHQHIGNKIVEISKPAAKATPSVPPQIVDPVVPPKVEVVDDAGFLQQPQNIPPSALQPDLTTPEVVKEAKKRGRKPKNTPEEQKVAEAEDKARSAQFVAEQNQQRMLEQKKQEQQGRINHWRQAYQAQPNEYLAASDLGRKDYEKALTAVSPMRLMEMVDDGVVRGAFTAQEAADLKLPIASAARADVLKKFVDSIDPSKTPAQAERIAIESYSSLPDEAKALFGGSRDFGVQVSRYAGEARRGKVPAAATQPDLMTPEVVKEAKKRGRKPKATPEPQVAAPAPTQPMSAMEAMQAEAGIKPTTPPNEIALKSQALLQEVANKRGASDAEVAEMLLRGDTDSAIRRLETKPLDGLKIDGLMSVAKKNGILTDEQADAILAAIPQKFKGGMSVLDQARQVSDNLASKSKLESRIDQTETPEFKNWFGDWKKDPANASKVVDPEGKPLVVYHGTRYSDLGVAARKEQNSRTLERAAAEKEWLENSMPLRDELRKQRDVAREELNEAAKRLAEPLAPDKHSIDTIAYGLAHHNNRHDTLRDISKAWYPFARNQRSYTGPSGAILKKADDAFAAIEPFRKNFSDIENEISKIPRRPEMSGGKLVEEEPFFDTLRYGENDEGYLSAGSYFTADTRAASNYAGPYEGSGVLPVYLNLKNPYIHGVTVDSQVDKLANQIYDQKAQTLRNARADVDDYSRARATSQREALIQLGYDGEIRDSKLAGKSRAFEDTEYVAFYPEQIKSATGNRGTFDPNSKNILESQGGKASGAKMAPTKVDLNTLEGLPEQAKPIVGDMINKIGQRLFDDVTMEVGGDAAKAVTTGDIDMDTGFIRIYNSAIESGIVDKTTVHELWHHLSKYITPEEVRTVQKEFDDAVKAHQGPLPYELSSIDEYFAHKLTDLTMKYLGREKPASVIGSVWAKALDVFEHIWDAIRQTLGYDQTKKIMYSFLDGYRADAVKLSDSTLQQRLVGDVEINGNILDSQVDPIVPNRDIAGQLAQAKSAIMGKNLDDIGQSILDSAVGRTMTALLDQSALGQLTKVGIEAARLSWKGYREGVFKEREYMSHHLRTWYDLPNIREDIIMDEELGSLNEFITAAGGDKALGAKNRMIAARKIQNGRVNDLRRLLEKPMYDEEGKFIPGSFRVEEQELPAWVGQEKVNGQVVDNPARRQQVAQMFSSWRLKNAQILGDERKEGIVVSLVNGYFARLVSNLPGNNRSLWNPNYGKILDPTHPNVKRRKDWFVGYDDGTSVINDISVDAELSGAHARKLVREQISPAEIRQYGNVLWERYKDRLMGSHSQMTYGELAQADPKAFAKINKLTEEIMNLDPRHVEYQIPLFSNDLFSAMELRLEHHHRSIMHAKAIQHLIKKNATARNLIGGDGRGITLNELLKESKYDSKSARHIMEVGTRGETSLVADKHFWDQEIQPRINEVIRHYQAETAHYLRNPTHEVGTATGVAPYTDPGGRAFQVLPYEGDGIRRLVFPQFFDKKVPDVPNHVMKLEVNLDNPAETMVTWYDQVDDGANFVGESLSKILDNPTNVASRENYVSGLPLYALFDQITVPQDVGDAITKFVQGPRTLEEVKPIVRGYDKATNMWKMMQTGMLPFIGFHGRNFGSGQASNFYLGIQNDPRFKFKLSDPTTYLNPIRAFVQPIIDAHKIATGQTIKGAASMPQFAGMNLTDEAATEALRREIYAQGITGEKQGLSAEQLTDTVGTAASQFPGIDKAKSINPLAWQWSKPAEDSTFAQRWLMPWMSKGVMSDADIFRPGQLGRDLGGYTEALNRLAPYIAMRRQGFDPKAAAREVNRAQVDYTSLSNFNREYTRRLFPFASYTLGMTPTVFGELASRPGGGMGRTVMATTSAGQSAEQGVTPDYIRETASIPLGMSEDGTRSYITGFGLPFEDPLQFAQLARGNVSGVLRELGSRMNPVPKSLIEIMTGRSLYQAGPFGGREIEDLDPTIGRIIANINDLATGEKTEKAEPFLGNPWAEYLIANAGPGRMLNTARTITDPRKWDTIPWKLALNLGTGVRVADVSPSAQDAILRERLARVMKDFGGRMYTRPYFPDYAKESWSPQEAEDAAKIDALLKLLGQRAKDRRVQ